jgi:hypothetical protein
MKDEYLIYNYTIAKNTMLLNLIDYKLESKEDLLQAFKVLLEAKKLNPRSDDPCEFVLSRSGHILGIDVTLELDRSSWSKLENLYSGRQIKSNGYYNTDIPLKHLCELLKKYSLKSNLDPHTGNHFSTIQDGIAYTSFPYRTHPLKIFACQWPGHACHVAIYNDALVLSNAGEAASHLTSGVKIFKIKSELPLDESKIIALLTENKSALDFENKLAQIVNIYKPLITFSQIKPQKHGTCTFVNAKRIIMPCLALLGDKDPYKSYKDFTNWMRDYEIQRLIDAVKEAAKNKEAEKAMLLVEILRSYIIKVFTDKQKSDRKQGKDFIRAATVLSFLSEELGLNVTNMISLLSLSSRDKLKILSHSKQPRRLSYACILN